MPQRGPEGESILLLSYLTAQRNHVLGILEGLDEAALRRSVLPSGWSCINLVHHLALDVERLWFRAAVAGERAVIDGLADGDDAWQVPSEMSGSAVLALYRDEIRRADEIITATALDAAPAWWPEETFGDWRLDDLREIILHVMVETACHAGHLDAVRELLDGTTWLVLT